MIKLSPSILSCDFANLEQEVARIAAGQADLVHVDVMDGHFVPNITIGIPVVKSLRKVTRLPLDVHLMISDPLRYVEEFAKAGSDLITFHLESESDPHETIRAIHAQGKKAGVSIKPNTPIERLYPYLSEVEMALVMTVEPGFGGQSFMADMCPKMEAIRAFCEKGGLPVEIQVDGGINPKTAPLVAKAGATVLVAGSSVFGAEDYGAAIASIRRAAEDALH